MGKKDPRVDKYLSEAAPFARPILKRIRGLVHRNCPGVVETIKWNVPFFLADDQILCVMAAFNAHCNFGFWKGRSMHSTDGSRAKVGMGQLGRITSVDGLPSAKALAGYFKQAIALNAKDKEKAKSKAKRKGPAAKRAAAKSAKPALRMPPQFSRALRANKQATSVFAGFSPSKKRDYIEWIVEAKTEETRERRLETAVEWIAQGKSRQWKYEK